MTSELHAYIQAKPPPLAWYPRCSSFIVFKNPTYLNLRPISDCLYYLFFYALLFFLCPRLLRQQGVTAGSTAASVLKRGVVFHRQKPVFCTPLPRILQSALNLLLGCFSFNDLMFCPDLGAAAVDGLSAGGAPFPHPSRMAL